MSHFQAASFALILTLSGTCNLPAGDCCVRRNVSYSCGRIETTCCQIAPTCCTPRPQCCVVPPSCCGQISTPRPATTVAYFKFQDAAGDSFIIKLESEQQIREARAILNGTQTDRVHVSGLIVKTPAPYNPGWKYHLAPASISFFQISIEVCDSAIRYVNDHLDEVGGSFLPGNHWCPWSSKLVEEVRIP